MSLPCTNKIIVAYLTLIAKKLKCIRGFSVIVAQAYVTIKDDFTSWLYARLWLSAKSKAEKIYCSLYVHAFLKRGIGILITVNPLPSPTPFFKQLLIQAWGFRWVQLSSIVYSPCYCMWHQIRPFRCAVNFIGSINSTVLFPGSLLFHHTGKSIGTVPALKPRPTANSTKCIRHHAAVRQLSTSDILTSSITLG